VQLFRILGLDDWLFRAADVGRNCRFWGSWYGDGHSFGHGRRPSLVAPSRGRRKACSLRVRGRTVSFQVGDLTSRKVGNVDTGSRNPLLQVQMTEDARKDGHIAVSSGSCICRVRDCAPSLVHLTVSPSPHHSRVILRSESRTQGRASRQEVAQAAKCPQSRSDHSRSLLLFVKESSLVITSSTPSTGAHLSSCLLSRSRVVQ